MRYGTLSPKELVQAAKCWGISALALRTFTACFLPRCGISLKNCSCSVQLPSSTRKATNCTAILRAIDQNELFSRLDPKSVAKKTERLHPPEVLLDFYKTEYYFHEARMAGANIHAPCVNRSLWLTNIVEKDIHIGFVHLHGIEQKAAHGIVQQRAMNGPFRSLADFVNRVDITADQLEILIRIGAFRFTGMNKYELMWEKNAVFNPKTAHDRAGSGGLLFDELEERFSLPDLKESEFDQAFDEIELLGFPLRSPFDLLVERQHPGCIPAADMPAYLGKMVDILGYYVCRKDVRTVKGDLMNFGTWLDEEGHFFDTTHFPNFLKMSPFRGKGIYKITGKVVEEYGFPSIEVVKMERLAFCVDERYGE